MKEGDGKTSLCCAPFCTVRCFSPCVSVISSNFIFKDYFLSRLIVTCHHLFMISPALCWLALSLCSGLFPG